MKKKECIRLGITGSIGSGKSYFSSLLKDKGYPVISADDLSKDLLSTDKNIMEMVKKKFGEHSYKNELPDKNFLAQTVFNDPKKLNQLEGILHPVVRKKLVGKIDELCEKHKLVFVEAALIYEADMEDMFDYVVLITAEENTRLNRKKISGMSEEDFTQRNLNQIPDQEKAKRADFVFKNDGSKKELEQKAELLFSILGC